MQAGCKRKLRKYAHRCMEAAIVQGRCTFQAAFGIAGCQLGCKWDVGGHCESMLTCAWKQQLCRADAHPQRRLGLLAVSWDASAGSWDPPEAGDTSRTLPSLNWVTLLTTAARWASGSSSGLLEGLLDGGRASVLEGAGAAAAELCTNSCRMTALHVGQPFNAANELSASSTPPRQGEADLAMSDYQRSSSYGPCRSD